MKPFDLKQALAGEPVKLRDGSKAYVKYVMPEEYKGAYPLRGYVIDDASPNCVTEKSWNIVGNGYNYAEDITDIISMWEEPRPRVTFTLPCPLKEPQEGMWYLHPQYVRESSYSLDNHDDWISTNRVALENGFYFATQEDAQEWLDAIKEARR